MERFEWVSSQEKSLNFQSGNGSSMNVHYISAGFLQSSVSSLCTVIEAKYPEEIHFDSCYRELLGKLAGTENASLKKFKKSICCYFKIFLLDQV